MINTSPFFSKYFYVVKCSIHLYLAQYFKFQVATLHEESSEATKQPSTVAEVSEGKIDQVMSMLNEADPTLPESDPAGRLSISYQSFEYIFVIQNCRITNKMYLSRIKYISELAPLEHQVNGMGPLIDAELELVDRRYID